METPGNTNPNVLRGMLQNSSGGGNALAVKVEVDTETGKTIMDKTWKEIFDADCVSIYNVRKVEEGVEKSFVAVHQIAYYGTGTDIEYVIACAGIDSNITYFVTDFENGYPELKQ